jgi:hypothetical protein
VAKGTDALRQKTITYLPMLTDELPDEYTARLNRTVLYNATWRTIVGFLGLLFRKPPVLNTESAKIKEMAKDITLSGVSLNVMALELCEEAMVEGRVGIWVNYPVAGANDTLADAVKRGDRPSMHVIKAINIDLWRTMRVDNSVVLSLVKMREVMHTEVDEFESKPRDVWRVLDLVYVQEQKRYIYRVRVIGLNKKNEDELIEGPFYPKMNGDFMTEIPFVFISPDDTTPDIDEPPFVDLVDVNLAHYQLTADYEHGCHWSGIPTAVITGHEMESGKSLHIGGQTALVFPNPLTKATMLEVGVQGFIALEKNLDRKESQMVILGARLLEVQKPGIEAAETAQIHRSGEQSILASMSDAMSEGITKALRFFSMWAGESGDISYQLNREFFNTPMSPEMLNAIVKSWQSGAISDETKFTMLKSGEVYAPSTKFEDEQGKIKNSTGLIDDKSQEKQNDNLQ